MKLLQNLVDFLKKISYFGHQLETGEISRSFNNLQSLQDIDLPYFKQLLVE